MNSKPCPAEAELLAFADAALSPEQLRRVERHLEVCSSCAQQVSTLSQLLEDVAAPVAAPALDVTEHVNAVMKRVDALNRPAGNARRGLGALAVGLAAAAGVAFVLAKGLQPEEPQSYFAARGGPNEVALSRDVGVQLYAQADTLSPLAAGGSIRASTALTAGLRNSGKVPVSLLLFAVDSRHAVHWIAPEYSVPGSNPRAVSLLPGPAERLLPTSAVFDDLGPGSLRVIALISSEPAHVAEIEALTAHELTSEGLTKRFPRAEVREVTLTIVPEPSP